MTFFLEIKNRILLIFSGVFFTITPMYIYKHTMLFLIIKPNLSQKVNFYFICTNITEGFFSYWYIITIFCLHFLLIFIIIHICMFFLTGLYQYEKNFLVAFLLIYLSFGIFFFLIFNNVILPFSWSFFNNILFSSNTIKNTNYAMHHHYKSLNLFFEIRITEYLHFYFTLYFMCVLLTHMLLILSVQLNIYYKTSNFKNVQKYRKKLYFLFFIFSTVITPPDVFSQIFIALTLIMLLELLIFFIILQNQLLNPIKTN
jgi:sec-independent protein translocase protein TatC